MAIWLASAVALGGGRVVSLEHDPRKATAWRANIAEAGLDAYAELIEGDAFATLPALDARFDLCYIDTGKGTTSVCLRSPAGSLRSVPLSWLTTLFRTPKTWPRARRRDKVIRPSSASQFRSIVVSS